MGQLYFHKMYLFQYNQTKSLEISHPALDSVVYSVCLQCPANKSGVFMQRERGAFGLVLFWAGVPLT